MTALTPSEADDIRLGRYAAALASARLDAIVRVADGEQAEIRARLTDVEHLHQPTTANANPWCRVDGRAWPCPTTLALRGEP